MRKICLFILSASVILFLCNCSKSSDAPGNPIVGLWIGKMTAVNEPEAGTLYYSIDVRADSTILTNGSGADGNTYYSEGTWTISGTTFTANITSTTASTKGIKQILMGVYNNKDGTLIGTWENVTHDASGTISLNRVN